MNIFIEVVWFCFGVYGSLHLVWFPACRLLVNANFSASVA